MRLLKAQLLEASCEVDFFRRFCCCFTRGQPATKGFRTLEFGLVLSVSKAPLCLPASGRPDSEV